MTSLSEYSKFDHLDDDDDEDVDENDGVADVSSSSNVAEEASAAPPTSGAVAPNDDARTPSSSSSSSSSVPPAGAVAVARTRRNPETGRYVYEYEGRPVYEWEQTLDEVNVYVEVPPRVDSASRIVCEIAPTRLRLGLRGSDRLFLDEATFSKVNVGDSSWWFDRDDGVVNVVLSKAFKAETWESVLSGAGTDGEGAGATTMMDPATRQSVQKDMMLERFQEEHPGFDFRGAEFNGAPPDPRTFMGGVKYF